MSVVIEKSAPTAGEQLAPSAGTPWSIWVMVGVLTVVGIWIRWHHLGMPMRYDEAFTVWRYAARGLDATLASYSLPNNHVLHTFLVNLAIRAGGMSPEVVRLPAFAAGATLIPASFIVFNRLRGPMVGVLTAGLVAASSVLVDYSVNARGYTLAALWAVTAVGVATGIIAKGHAPVRVLALGLIGAAGLWTVPVFAYAWVGILVWLAVEPSTPWRFRLRPALAAAAISAVTSLLVYSPIIRNDGWDALVANRFVTPDPIPAFLSATPRFLSGVAAMWTRNMPAVLVVTLVAGLLAAVVGDRSRSVRRLARSLLGAAAGLYLAQHVVPYPRNWLVLLPLILGVAAAGVVTLVQRLRPSLPVLPSLGFTAVVTGWLVVSLLTGPGSLSGEDDGLVDAEAITLELAPLLREGDHVLAAIPSTAPLRYYFELHALGVDALRAPTGAPDDLYVVTARSQTPAEVLESSGVPPGYEFSALSRYPSGQLWQATPTELAP